MNKLHLLPMVIFCGILCLLVTSGIAAALFICSFLPLGAYHPLAVVLLSGLFTFLEAILEFRLFQHLAPLKPGEVKADSTQHFVYQLYLAHFLLIFYPVMRSGALPVPLTRPLYRALGCSMGCNSYTGGIILDPPFVTIGSNALLGQGSLIVPHVIENDRLAHYPIRIGSDVTVGAHAIVLAGVEIGEGALIASGSVVKKNTRIGMGERWGGVPARLLRGEKSTTSEGYTEGGRNLRVEQFVNHV
jgi:Bacterial transferase hexapeptide (six repeats)